ncbi:MAG: type II toxin-antitoxin system HipA family toxin, partial [Steroidobacteraceae bacterium]
VTTSLYAVTHPRTFITKYDRTLALNLRKSRNYPDRDTLLAFGREDCGVVRPEATVERIADALSTTLKEQRHRIPSALWAQLNEEWRVGL